MLLLDARGMIIDLSSLKTGSNRGVFEIDLEPVDWMIEDVHPAGGTGTLDLDVNYTERSIIVRGRFEALFATTCARCLARASFEVAEDVFAVFSRDGAMDSSETPAVKLPRGGRSLSLLDAVREAVILSVPGKPLCREDCRGLCPVCGEDLNVNRCGHDGVRDTGCVR